MRLKPFERNICYLLAAYSAVAVSLVYFMTMTGNKNPKFDKPWWWLAVSYALVGLFAFLTWKTNRMFAGIAGVLCVYAPVWVGRYAVAAFPLLGLMLFLTFRISKDRRKLVEARMARGDYGVDPRTAADRARAAKRAAKNPVATQTQTGKPLAPASKRYTPPKAKAKK